jgi:predicted lipoprotein with Yx(FWY)xxD motif
MATIAAGPTSVALVLLLVLAGCGTDEGEGSARRTAPAQSSATAESPSASPSASRERDRREEQPGTTVTVDGSPFGQMLFDDRGQAIYLFQPEADGRPACYGECETAWPPVLTRGEPVASGGLRPTLLGTVERRDGSRQVTYGGWPLYFYAHEGPGEVLCHDVVLNGGLWLAVGPDGRALPT